MITIRLDLRELKSIGTGGLFLGLSSASASQEGIDGDLCAFFANIACTRNVISSLLLSVFRSNGIVTVGSRKSAK